MRLDSIECTKALIEYKVESEMERMAIKVLMAKPIDVADIPGMKELTDTQLDELVCIIQTIRNDLGIGEK